MVSNNIDISQGHIADYAPSQQDNIIFNHDIMNCTNEEVVGNYLYSGRALGLTEPKDLIQIHPELKNEWPYIAEHYERIGLSFTRSIIWDTSYRIFDNYASYKPSFFYYGDELYDSYTSPNFFHIVNFINSKNNFMHVAQDHLALPIPQTFCYENKHEITDTAVFPYPCYVKAAISVSGVGIYRCESATELFHALNTFDDYVPLQIQEEIIALSFLNVQYKVTQTKAERFAITEQLLEGFSHKGNRHPSEYSCWHITDKFAEYLYNKGMQGIFAFDVAVINKDDTMDYRLIECNPRFNGASYPTWIAKKLGVDEWTAEAFSTNIRSIKDLDLSDIVFNPVTKTGVVLVNWGPIRVGKFSVLIIGSAEQQEVYRQKLMDRI